MFTAKTVEKQFAVARGLEPNLSISIGLVKFFDFKGQ